MEKAFYDNLNEVRKVVIKELERTTEDFEHQGDKTWNKHYKDGVNE